MITTSDKEYIQTKKIKQGIASMNPDFVPLVNWMLKKYGIAPLNIIYDTVITAGEHKRRIEIIFEYFDQEKLFRDDAFTLNKGKQKDIINFFRWNIDVRSNNRFLNWLLKPYSYFTNTPFVISSSFMPLAVAETNNSIPNEDIEELKKQIHDTDLWQIVRNNAQVILFFYTNLQMKEYDNGDFKKEIALKYHTLIKQYDEFNYITRNSISIFLDSKENFDANYESNWFYYFR